MATATLRDKIAWCVSEGIIDFDGTPDEEEVYEAIMDYVHEHWPDVDDPFGYATDYRALLADRAHDQMKDH